MRKLQNISIWLLLALPIVITLVIVGVARASATQKKQINSTNCASEVQSIGCALDLWAVENEGRLPRSFIGLSNEFDTPQIFVCPSDRKTEPATNWVNFTDKNTSYELGAPDSDLKNTNTVIVRCRIHKHMRFADGRIVDGVTHRAIGK